ncbi:MAG: hypothetical protein J7L45_02625 [Candidatus Aenigmarchaeota archaeon]|nr:hypothetical protein [Candidatus Aenigmarchaeota archaeon]
MISLPFKKGGQKVDPVDRVQELTSLGKSEKEIIRTMKEEGYSNEEIASALNKAIKFKVTSSYDAPSPYPPPIESPQPGPNFVAPPPQESFGTSSGDENVIEMNETEEIELEELIEEIVEEKLADIRNSIDGIQREFGQIQEQIDVLNQRIDKLESSEKEREKQIKDMLEESSSQMQRIEGRIGSVERAFKEFLPTLTENVRSLSAIVEKMKKKSEETNNLEPSKN